MQNFDWQGLIGALLVLLAVGFGTERGTEVLKAISRLIGAKMNWEGLSGYTSLIAAAALVIAGTFYFDIEPLKYIRRLGFNYLDPDLVKLLSSLIGLFIANKIHDKGK